MATDETDPETPVDDRYSVIVPADIRQEVDLEPGDRLRWHVDDGRLVAEVVRERYGVAADLQPIDMGETDAVEVGEGYDWS